MLERSMPKRPRQPVALEPRCLTIADAAAYCGLTPGGFRHWVAIGRLPVAIPGTHRWDRKAIDLALDRLSGLPRGRPTNPRRTISTDGSAGTMLGKRRRETLTIPTSAGLLGVGCRSDLEMKGGQAASRRNVSSDALASTILAARPRIKRWSSRKAAGRLRTATVRGASVRRRTSSSLR